jgi:hypothetical protein
VAFAQEPAKLRARFRTTPPKTRAPDAKGSTTMTVSRALLGAMLAVLPASFASAAQNSPKKICIDPQHSESRVIASHEILTRNALGHERPELKLSTTCLFLRPTDSVRVSSSFNCVDLGDIVVAANIDGHIQTCRVSGVEKYLPPDGDAPK